MKRFMTFLILLGLCLLVFSSTSRAANPSLDPDESQQLFTESEALDVEINDPTVVRARFVTVKFDLLATGKATELTLNLFDEIQFTAQLSELITISDKDQIYLWQGTLPTGRVTLSVVDDVLTGNIVTPSDTYHIRYVGDGLHAIYQIDESAYPPEAEPIPVETEPKGAASALSDDGSVIDVMVVYTSAARAAAGGTSAMQSLINLGMSETNTGLNNAQVNFDMNLVHTAEVSYSGSGNANTDLSRLRDQSDGYMDQVHSWRDSYNADLVSLWVENGGGYCGIGYLMTTLSTNFESSAFSIAARNCATGYYTFAHEMGHNMGSTHDPANGGSSVYPYSQGHQAPNGAFRSIMAYDCSGGCPRINYWSNPNVSYGGQSTGVSGLSDNALSLNNVAQTVANFRQGETGDSYEPDNSSSQANWISSGSAQTHSIVPADDQDWVKFTLSAESAVTLETSGASGDTRMWLYNSSLTEIEYDDDDGTSTFSLIERVCGVDALPAGTYYVKVDEYGNDNQIASYSLSFTRTTCPPPQLPDLRITSMRIELDTGSQCYMPSSTLGVRVWFENAGQANAGPFVVEVNGVQQSVSAGLGTGEATSLWFIGYESGQNSAFVDANTQVTESDENNNQLTQYLAVPTPPITCTNTPTPSATPSNTPTPSATPTNTPTPSPSGNVDLILSPASVNTGVGQTFDVAIQVQAGSQQVDGAAGYLNFNPNYLEVVSVTGGNAFSLEIVNDFDNVAGHVDFAAGTFSNLPSGTFTLATVTFEAIAQTNSSPISFNSASPRLSDATFGGGTVLDSTTGNTVTVHNAVLNGSVTYQGRPSPPHARWAMPLNVSLTIPGESTPAYQFSPTTDQSGNFSVTGFPPGTYEVRVKHSHTLQVMQTVTLAGTNSINFGTLREGDANNNNQVSLVDFSILATTFGKCEGTTGFDGRADFNEDDCIALTDFSLLASNFGQGGQSAPMTANRASEVSLSDVAMSISPAQTSIKPGETFNVTVRLDAGEQQVDGAQIRLNFEPDVLVVEEVMTTNQLALELANQFDNESGTIQFAAGTLQVFPEGEILVMTIQFKALKEGETALAFELDGAMGSDVTFAGASVLGSHADGVVTVNEPSAVTLGDISTHTTINSLLATLALLGLAGLTGVFARRNR